MAAEKHLFVFKTRPIKETKKLKQTLNTAWRKSASTIYKKPNDSKIFGSVEIDVTDLELYIQKKRREGLKVTLTHIFLLAVARAIKENIPELNTYVKRGNIYSFPSIDTTVSVLLPSGDMGSVKIKNVDSLLLSEAVEVLAEKIKKTKSGEENQAMKMKDKLSVYPWPLRGFIYKVIKTITTDWGFSLPFIGVDSRSFGSFILSNIGTLGLDNGFPALLPTANISFVMMLGGIQKKPWVVNNTIEIRRIMTLGAALDHRVVDASHAGKLFKYLKKIVRNPQLLEKEL
jgi:pyruvate/2-oxoglutarate dehydrogenase complex dihydrolipoamide acyltransferase (E2) component